METPKRFVEEIHHTDLQICQLVNEGSFGIISLAYWKGREVAVKLIADSNKDSFSVELKQLSRIDHPHIVKLYGVCRSPFCLVMEFAEGGSLNKVLHEDTNAHFTPGLAISWMYQCAVGVEYLHGIKPKPLIHRDLKPANLLLIDQGRFMKICDFGLSREKSAHMSGNRGSAYWMAPEVFAGQDYNEKCDLFSFGITVWQILTRKFPMAEHCADIAFKLMWDYYKGKRPAPISNCPKPLAELMVHCWDQRPSARPSMTEVVRVLKGLREIFKGADEPVYYISTQEDDNLSFTSSSKSKNIEETRQTLIKNTSQQELKSEDERARSFSMTSAPPSLAASMEHLDVTENRPTEGEVTPVPKKRGHRRTGSHGQKFVTPPNQLPNLNEQNMSRLTVTRQNRSGSGSQSYDKTGSSASLTPGTPIDITKDATWVEAGISRDDVNRVNALACKLEYQPLAPDFNCPQSVHIFNEHCRLAKSYLEAQVEIQFLTSRKFELDKELETDLRAEQADVELQDQLANETSERDSLANFLKQLQQQVNLIRQKNPQNY